MPSIPKTCKVGIFEKPNAGLVFKEVDVPEPKKGEILIKTIACGICHSDSAFGHGAFGADGFPRIPGHEVVGEVVKLGEGVENWKIGDRAGGAWHGGHDGTCKQCKRGFYQMCTNELINGISRDGGYAEYCTLRSEAAVPIPADIDPVEAAPLLCAGVTLFNGIRKMNIVPGEVVAIQGLGGLGHLGLQYARKMGYRTVALSSSASKKDFAMKLGANDYVDGSKEKPSEALQKLGGAALIVATAPNPEIMPDLVNGLAPMGKLLILAPVGEVPVPTVPMIMKGLSVHGWPSGHSLDCEEAVAFAGHHDVNCMIEKFSLEQANEAMKKMEEGKIRFRGVIVF